MKTLAVVKGISFGCRDIGRPCLWFSTYINESVAALQVLTGKEMLDAIAESGVYDIKELEGKPCWVETDGKGWGGLIKFVGFWGRHD